MPWQYRVQSWLHPAPTPPSSTLHRAHTAHESRQRPEQRKTIITHYTQHPAWTKQSSQGCVEWMCILVFLRLQTPYGYRVHGARFKSTSCLWSLWQETIFAISVSRLVSDWIDSASPHWLSVTEGNHSAHIMTWCYCRSLHYQLKLCVIVQAGRTRCRAEVTSKWFLLHLLDLPTFLKSMILVSTSPCTSDLSHVSELIPRSRHIPQIRADCGFMFCVYKLIFSKSKDTRQLEGRVHPPIINLRSFENDSLCVENSSIWLDD